jgi:branched-chain amino acid transport system ATP-binding protein
VTATPAAGPDMPTTRDQSGSVLAVEQLEVVYNHVQLAVQGVSLCVKEREIVAVLGTNGAGKTTTLRAISGFLPGDNADITDGKVLLDGTDVAGSSPHLLARRGVVLVPERDKVFMTLTVEENLEVVPTLGTAADRERAMTMVSSLFPVLADRSRSLAGYLSGGERQMLAVAKGLLLNPRVLLIDELSFGLAPQVVERLMGTLTEVHERDGVSIILVEQNAEAALGIADHAYVLENGRVVMDGTPDQLRAHEDVQEFYLGVAGDQGYADLKQYKRRRRWWG